MEKRRCRRVVVSSCAAEGGSAPQAPWTRTQRDCEQPAKRLATGGQRTDSAARLSPMYLAVLSLAGSDPRRRRLRMAAADGGPRPRRVPRSCRWGWPSARVPRLPADRRGAASSIAGRRRGSAVRAVAEGVGPDGKPQNFDGWPHPAFRLMRAGVRGEAELIAVLYAERADVSHASGREIERPFVQYVSGWMFGTFGLRAAAGRLLGEADDDQPRAHPYAVLSYDYWTRRFGRDPAVVGRTFSLGATSSRLSASRRPSSPAPRPAR